MTTHRVERFDRAEELSAPRETPEGFLVVEGFVSRPGIYRYLNTREDEALGLGPEGAERLELRPESEVFSERSRASYRTRSITVGHPRKAGKRIRVDASNVRDFEVGSVDGPARRVGERLAASLVIKDKAAIADAKAGKRQLSPGHFVDLVVEKGVDPKYGRYDCIQRDIEINHLALVEKARGGNSLQLRLDGEELREDEHARIENSEATITIADSGGHTHALVEERSPFLAPLRSDEVDMADNDTIEIENLRAQNETLLKRIGELEDKAKLRLDAAEEEAVKKATQRADEAEQKLAKVMTARKADIQARVVLERVAGQFMGEHYRCDGKDDDVIKKDVVRRLDSSLNISSMTPSRLDGHFEALVRLHQKSREDYADLGRTIGAGGVRREDEAVEKKLDNDWNNQWKRAPASTQMLKKEI